MKLKDLSFDQLLNLRNVMTQIIVSDSKVFLAGTEPGETPKWQKAQVVIDKIDDILFDYD